MATLDLPSFSSPIFAENGSEHLSQLGDSTSLFSPNTSQEVSPQPLPKPRVPQNPIEEEPTSPCLIKLDYYPSPQNRLSVSERQRQKFSKSQGKRSVNMVIEREPPKTANSPASQSNQTMFGNYQPPEFGKPSPLHSRIQSSVFNIPKPKQKQSEQRNEELDAPSPLQNPDEPVRGFVNPFQPRKPVYQRPAPGVVEIPRPANHPTWAAHRPAQPVFSSIAPNTIGFSAVNSKDKIGNFVDLTTSLNQFKQDNVFYDEGFAAPDPYTYIDTEKATENIKALLEGAFEDEEDKPRTRGRKKKIEATVLELTDKLKVLDVENEHKRPDKNEDENAGDEEDEEDDGTVEGLKVKLLPHQVDGVEWMTEKEIGARKKNGVLPKGGILADDVSISREYGSIINNDCRWVLVKPSNPFRSY